MWVPIVEADPGIVDTVEGDGRRICFRCLTAVSKQYEGLRPLRWHDEPPTDGERCRRCERLFS